MIMRNYCAFVLAGLIAIAGTGSSAPAQDPAPATLTVFAAASLKNALDEAAIAFTVKSGTRVTASYAASSALAKQIEAGAPADVYFSADTDWMDYLDKKGHISPSTRRNLLGNTLVLVAAAGKAPDLRITEGFALSGALGDDRLALANADSVPAGKYAKAALQALGVWQDVTSKLAQTENVRAALAFVAQGEAPLGIVYKTDALAEAKVTIVGAFPPSSHPAIVYPAAAVRASSQQQLATALIEYLASPEAAEIFAKHGFSRVPEL